VTKEIDNTTPALFEKMAAGAELDWFVLELWQDVKTATFYRIELHRPSVVDIRQEQLFNRVPENMAHLPREQVSFSYWTLTATPLDDTRSGRIHHHSP